MSDSSDDHRAVSKNGKDAHQDRAIRDLAAEVRGYQQHDQQAHGEINHRLDTIREQQIAESARREVREKFGAQDHEDAKELKRLVVKSSISLAVALLTQGGALLGWGWAQFDEMRTELQEQTAETQKHVATLERQLERVDVRTQADWQNGREWGARIDRTDDRQDTEIAEIRRRLGLPARPGNDKDDDL